MIFGAWRLLILTPSPGPLFNPKLSRFKMTEVEERAGALHAEGHGPGSGVSGKRLGLDPGSRDGGSEAGRKDGMAVQLWHQSAPVMDNKGIRLRSSLIGVLTVTCFATSRSPKVAHAIQ